MLRGPSILLLILSMTSWAGLHVDIHYAFPKGDRIRKILDPSIEDYLPSYSRARKNFFDLMNSRGVEVREIEQSTTDQIIASLKDPEVLGIIWVGHTKLAYETDVSNKQNPFHFYNSHLVDPRGVYLPKGLLSAAHRNLEFFALNTCYFSEFKRYYQQNSLLKLINAFSADEAELSKTPTELQADNALIGQRTIYNKLLNDMKTGDLDFHPPEAAPLNSYQLEVEYRDLYSHNFVYEVLVNGKLVGTLQPHEIVRGKIRLQTPQARASISFQSEATRLRVTIRPDDAARYSPHVKHPIDNILVDRVALHHDGKTLELQNLPMNLGDEDAADEEISLSNADFEAEMKALPVHAQLDWDVPGELRP